MLMSLSHHTKDLPTLLERGARFFTLSNKISVEEDSFLQSILHAVYFHCKGGGGAGVRQIVLQDSYLMTLGIRKNDLHMMLLIAPKDLMALMQFETGGFDVGKTKQRRRS